LDSFISNSLFKYHHHIVALWAIGQTAAFL
jgi:hypothetical protein